MCPPTDVSDTNLETQAGANVTVVAHILDDTFGGTSGSDSVLGRNIAANASPPFLSPPTVWEQHAGVLSGGGGRAGGMGPGLFAG